MSGLMSYGDDYLDDEAAAYVARHGKGGKGYSPRHAKPKVRRNARPLARRLTMWSGAYLVIYIVAAVTLHFYQPMMDLTFPSEATPPAVHVYSTPMPTADTTQMVGK